MYLAVASGRLKTTDAFAVVVVVVVAASFAAGIT